MRPDRKKFSSYWNSFHNTTFKIQLKVDKTEKKNLEKSDLLIFYFQY